MSQVPIESRLLPRLLTLHLSSLLCHTPTIHSQGMLMSQVPIESKFQEMLVDNLNAELVLGTVTNVKVGRAGQGDVSARWSARSGGRWLSPRALAAIRAR